MTSYDPNQYPEGGQSPQYPAGGQPQYQGYGQLAGLGGYGPSTEKNNLGNWALGLGIASFVCCGLLAGIPAAIVGYLGLQAANEGKATNKGFSIAGIVLGALSIVWTIIALSTGILSGLYN